MYKSKGAELCHVVIHPTTWDIRSATKLCPHHGRYILWLFVFCEHRALLHWIILAVFHKIINGKYWQLKQITVLDRIQVELLIVFSLNHGVCRFNQTSHLCYRNRSFISWGRQQTQVHLWGHSQTKALACSQITDRCANTHSYFYT